MNRKSECGCSEEAARTDKARRPAAESPTAFEILRDRPVPPEFLELVRQGNRPRVPDEELLPACLPIGIPAGERGESQIPPLIDKQFNGNSLLRDDSSATPRRPSYLTDWQLDLTAVPHMTSGLAQLSGARLAAFVNNNFNAVAMNRMVATDDWIDAGPDQKTGVYSNSDGSLRVRFDAIQKSNRKIQRRDLESGLLRFSADQMQFIVLVERGNLNPTRCIRFVQVKRGFVRLFRNNGKFNDIGPNLIKNKLFEFWTIDDSSEPRDLQLGTKRRRDGQISTSTCDTPGVPEKEELKFQWKVEYSVEFILYIVSCCCGNVEESESGGGLQILFALPWEVKIEGSRPLAGRTIEPRYRQRMSEVVVAPPDRSLIPVINDVISPKVCKPIRLETEGSPCFEEQ